MSTFVDRPRYSCALGGALAVLRAIPRAIPIIHASAGCGQNLGIGINAGGGYLGGGYCGGNALPSSNISERDIVFGGDDRLREQIENTLKLMDGDVYIVLTGCMVEMIGDDIDSIVCEFQDGDVPVIAVHTPSFRGNSYVGYEFMMSAFAKKYVSRQASKNPKKVNILGIVPSQDAFWSGNLREIKRILELLGLEVNTFFGEDSSLEDIKNAGNAGLSIVLSDIHGIETARTFEEVHDIPYITTGLPIGANATEDFLRVVAKKLELDKTIVDKVIVSEKKIYYNYIERTADIYNDVDLQRYAVVIGDSNYAPAISRFLSDELGWLPELAIVTDQLLEEQEPPIKARFDGFRSGLVPNVRFTVQTARIRNLIAEVWERNKNEKYYDSMSPAVMIGSSIERDLAEKLGMPLLTVTYPLTGRIVLNKAYAGFKGGLALTEDVLGILVAGR
jgi:nitrogenase molybdenum-iron protein beta chain